MSASPIQFEKTWIEQCQATQGIRGHFGLHNALDYLIGEKLFSFVHASEQHPEFAAVCVMPPGLPPSTHGISPT